MFSTRRRWTASSSTIKMQATMAFLGRYNYLSRIGALSPKPINALLNVGVPSSPDRFRSKRTYRLEPDERALFIRPPQVDRSTQIRRQEKAGQECHQERDEEQGRQAAGMEPGRPLFRHRRAGNRPRPREDGQRMRCV